MIGGRRVLRVGPPARVGALVVAALALLPGCSVDNYSQDSVRRDLRDAGLTAAQARCVADAMEKRFGAAVLASRRDRPSEADRAAQRKILERCDVLP